MKQILVEKLKFITTSIYYYVLRLECTQIFFCHFPKEWRLHGKVIICYRSQGINLSLLSLHFVCVYAIVVFAKTKCSEHAIKHKMLTCPSGEGPRALSCNIPLGLSLTWLLSAQSCCQRHMCKLCGALNLNSELRTAIWFYLHYRICCLLYAGRVHQAGGWRVANWQMQR